VTGPEDLTRDAWTFWLSVALCVFLVAVAGLMSGLTLGLLSLDRTDLSVILRGPSGPQKQQAAALEPLLRDSHRLLVTLVLCNAAAMEALPMVVDRLTSPAVSLALSVTVVLLFGEILPQALCSRYGLAVGYYTLWVTKAVMWVTFPVTWPIAKCLDLAIGHSQRDLPRRAELRSMMDLYVEAFRSAGEGSGAAGEPGGPGPEFSEGELNVIRGALDLAVKPCHRAMTPLARAFMLEATAVLDRQTLGRVVDSGFSRIPIHLPGRRGEIIGLLMVKDLALVEPSRATPVADLMLRSAPRVFSDISLQDLLDLFQTGRSHLALLVERPDPGARFRDSSEDGGLSRPLLRRGASGSEASRSSGSSIGDIAVDIQNAEALEQLRGGEVVGIITMEDVIEELLQEEIVDETDQYMDNTTDTRVTPAALNALVPPRLRAALQRGFVVKKGRLAREAAPRPGGALRDAPTATTDPEVMQQLFYSQRRAAAAGSLEGAGGGDLPRRSAASPRPRPADAPGTSPPLGAGRLQGSHLNVALQSASRRPRPLVVVTDPEEMYARHGLPSPGVGTPRAISVAESAHPAHMADPRHAHPPGSERAESRHGRPAGPGRHHGRLWEQVAPAAARPHDPSPLQASSGGGPGAVGGAGERGGQEGAEADPGPGGAPDDSSLGSLAMRRAGHRVVSPVSMPQLSGIAGRGRPPPTAPGGGPWPDGSPEEGGGAAGEGV